MNQPVLQRITIYPIKSLDGMEVDRAEVLAGGALRWDRRWALADAEGRFLNGKRTAAVHSLRTRYELRDQELVVHVRPHLATAWETFVLPGEKPKLERWLQAFFDQPVRLLHRPEGGFPDDTDAPGPTLVSTASLEEVGRWFGLPLEQLRRRFRANLELGGVPPFWEDRLVLPGPGQGRRFCLGTAVFQATGICQRCAVPPRDPDTGKSLSEFARRFAQQRQQTLPAWSPRERFDHFYRLAINTRGLETPAVLRTGDVLQLLD